MFQQLLKQFLQKFVKNMGRGPQNRAEWMQIQDDAVRHLNKTKGGKSQTDELRRLTAIQDLSKGKPPGYKPSEEQIRQYMIGRRASFKDREWEMPGDKNLWGPEVEEKTGIEELLKGPVRSKGPKGDRTWDFSKKQKKGDVVDLFASEKEFGDDLYSIGQNIIKNDPMFNLELATTFRNPGTKIYSAHGTGKLHSPSQRQKILDNLKKVMKHDTYQAQHAEELGFVDLTDDIFTIEKASGGRVPFFKGKIAKGILSLGKKKKFRPSLEQRRHNARLMGEEIKPTKKELEYEKLLREKATESFYKNWGIDRKTGLKIEKASGGRIGHYGGGIAPLVGEPSYSADFYDDRTPYKVGKIVKGIKTLLKKKKPKVKTTPFTGRVRSDLETIHLPKVKKDRLATADELEDYREILDPSGEAYIVEEGMMVKELDKMVAEQKAYERHMFLEYKKGNLDPTAGDKSPARKQFLEKKLEDMEMSGDKRLMTRDEIEELSSFDLGTEMDAAVKKPRVHTLDERTALKQKYPGLTDDLLDKILIDDNPQRKADVIGTIDDYMKLREIGKSEGEAFDIITRSFSKTPTKHAEGGRADFIFGGSAGLKGMWQTIMKSLSKKRGEPITKLFPKLSADERRMEKLVMGTPEQKVFREGEVEHKLEGIDLLINRLKHDKKIIERQAKNKAMGDSGLDFMMKKLEENMPDVYGPHLKKYTDIDKDILQMENIKKNLIMKDRKLNAEGGRIGYSGGGKAGLPAVTMGTPQMNMQGPQMPAGPQPAGISGANLQMNQMDLMQQKMQQDPWMGQQMKQGIGGMQKPQYGGQLRMPFGKGGMGRRAFMKMMAAITGTGIAGGTGLLKLGKAAKVVPKVTETITRGADGMPAYLTDLIEVVKAKGTRDVIEGFKKSDYSTVHSYKGVDVIEEASGTTRIKRPTEGVATDSRTGKMHEGTSKEIEMEISPRYIEQSDPESGLSWFTNEKGRKVYETKIPDEYAEYTARPDMDGKLKEVDEGIDDMDHLDLKTIADEVDTLIIKKTKKASGGLAYALGE